LGCLGGDDLVRGLLVLAEAITKARQEIVWPALLLREKGTRATFSYESSPEACYSARAPSLLASGRLVVPHVSLRYKLYVDILIVWYASFL